MPDKGVTLVKVITKTLERESKNNLHDLYPQTFLFKKIPYIYYAYCHARVHCYVQVQVRAQPVGLSFLLLPCGSLEQAKVLRLASKHFIYRTISLPHEFFFFSSQHFILDIIFFFSHFLYMYICPLNYLFKTEVCVLSQRG